MPSRERLLEFVGWCGKHITGDEKGQAQIFLERLFQAFGQGGSLVVGGSPEFRIRKATEFRVYRFRVCGLLASACRPSIAFLSSNDIGNEPS